MKSHGVQLYAYAYSREWVLGCEFLRLHGNWFFRACHTTNTAAHLHQDNHVLVLDHVLIIAVLY